MSGGLEVGQSLPVYPNKLTISEPSRTSREGQKPKWTFWGCSVQTDVACPSICEDTMVRGGLSIS